MSGVERVSSGTPEFDRLLAGLNIGDNVLWYDDAGSLAWVFCQNLIEISRREGHPLVYVSFDRSPKNLLDRLGPMVDHPGLTILDCFTYGKGAGNPVFVDFYRQRSASAPCRIEPVENPADPVSFSQALFALQAEYPLNARFIFESVTGMQDLWGSEDEVIPFYLHTCPRLYELNTVAYWLLEKEAHSQRLRAQLNKTAQVVVELSIKRGTTSLNLIKADNREPEALRTPVVYWTEGLKVHISGDGKTGGPLDLGGRLKEMRATQRLSQSDLARLVGVSASNICQIEGNLIHPSLPALIRMAEVLGVEVGDFFGDQSLSQGSQVYVGAQARPITLSGPARDEFKAWRLMPPNAASAAPLLVEIPGRAGQQAHFLAYKGRELGYLLSGRLRVEIAGKSKLIHPGDTIYLAEEQPTVWENPSPEPARLFWLMLD